MADFIGHIACPACGSSDGNALYADQTTFCWVCKKWARVDGAEHTRAPRERKPMLNMIPLSEISYDGGIPPRLLTEESCVRWKYGYAKHEGEGVHVATYFGEDGSPVAQKLRYKDKTFKVLGDAKGMSLYGKHLWRDGGKKVVITEGEIDAISVSQVQDHRWPVVSLPHGANTARKAIEKDIEWLAKFDEVILMFDNDEYGQAAVKEVADVLPPGKCKVATLPLKDANDMLQAKRASEIVPAIWNARTYRPDGIIAGTETWDMIENFDVAGNAVPFPYPNVNEKTMGYRAPEIIMVAAGSGVGKSEIASDIAYHAMTDHNETVGYLAFEEPVARSGMRFMSQYLKCRLHLDPKQVSQEKRREAWEKTVGSGRLFLYDHFGSMDSENLFNRIRFMVTACGCKTVFLDHISIIVSGMDDTDGEGERRMIDKLMTRLRSLVEELGFRLVLVCHLKKPDGTPHEEGGRVTLDDLRGSGALKQLSDTILGAERNQQDPIRRNWTMLRVLKCRWTGNTGEADWLYFDADTGTLEPMEPVFLEDTPQQLTGQQGPTEPGDF